MLNLTYEYGTPAGNDGRIRRIQDLVVPDRTVSYEFDALGRLASAETTGGAAYPKWCIGWTYDPQSNRLSQRNLNGENRPGGGTYACPGVPSELTLEISSTTNRVTSTGWSHDATGNVTATPDGSFSIDAAGRTIGHTPASGPALGFAFDATGLRTKRTEGASTTLYLRDGGQVVGEWNGTSWSKEYVWLGSTLLATFEGGSVKYHHADHLSIRATTFADGMVGEEQGHYPFGEPWYETSPETTRIFTTYERETGGTLDYAMFRWMGPEAGRFLSADPVHGSMGDGQSWNRYAYAGNDPVNRIDPLGLRSGSPTPFHRSYEAPFWAMDLQTGAIFGGGVDMPLWFTVDDPETFYGGWEGFYEGAGAAGGAWDFAGWKHGPCYTTTSYVWDADVGSFVFALEVRCPNDRPVFVPRDRPVAPPNPPEKTKPWKWEKTGSYNSLTFSGYDFWENLRMAPAGAPCECWWVKMPCDAPVLRSGTIANPESAVSFPPGDPPPGVQVTRALMFSDRNNPEARNRCPCFPFTPFPGCR